MKTIRIFFGEMGCGKSYLGQRFAQEDGCTFWDGDEAVTPEMLEQVLKFKPLTREMVTAFVGNLKKQIIIHAEAAEGDLIVSQALYSNSDRNNLFLDLTYMGFNVEFHWVRCSFWMNLKNLWTRPNGLKWIYYWLVNKPWFEKPNHKFIPVINDYIYRVP